ncbi:hypothetical protein G6F23_014914 [Rhizopus arrhizus]|nr:hypothetical protein G6F23_014914 [Rhizopus arrhizus]
MGASVGWPRQVRFDPLQLDAFGTGNVVRATARDADDGVARAAQAFDECPTEAPAGADDHQLHVASLYAGGAATIAAPATVDGWQ